MEIPMSDTKTLLQLAGVDPAPGKLREACVVLIDIQNEYLNGPIAVESAGPAVASAARLLASARSAGSPIFHIAHKGRAGGLFDRAAERGQLIEAVAPTAGETVVEKTLPNAFAGTDLHALLTATGRKELILAGFMTHMCVSSTARAALDLGYRTTVVAAASATRDLPDGLGGVVPAATIHKVALVELSDRFAVIVQVPEDIV
jgi:nicotinamidase-related amidase